MLSKESKIMLVDDSKLIRSAVKKFLNKLGYENIVEAADGQEAVDTHASSRADFIIMDIVMPNLTGNLALAKIREEDKLTPVVMLTSVDEERMVKECSEHGVLGYIVKPIERDVGPEVLLKFLAMV